MSKSLITINKYPISKKDFMDSVDNELIKLHDTKDINRIMSVLDGLGEVESITGKGKAKLLWGANQWYKVNCPGENFSEHVLSMTRDIKKVTISRYILTWGYIEDYTIPKEISDSFPMRDLVPIAMTLSQGYDISKEQWRKIKNTTNSGELREVLREVQGKAERKSAKVLKIDEEGNIYLYIKGKPKKFIGYLNVLEAKDDNDIADEIEKIKIARGMVEE